MVTNPAISIFRPQVFLMKLHFLGTGGGRYTMGKQLRDTAGLILESGEASIFIDPGPGALVKAHNYETENLEGLIITHSHLDHYSDAESIIELISVIHENPCKLMGPVSVLEGYGDMEQSVSNYHQNQCTRTVNLTEKEETEIGDLKIESQEMFHSEPKCRGLKISNGEKKFGFWTDSAYSDELLEFYEDCDTLVINCNRPREGNIRGHISLTDVPKILEELDVKTVIITHFGDKFLESDMEEEQAWLDDQVDAKVIFSEDGMTYPGDRKLSSF